MQPVNMYFAVSRRPHKPKLDCPFLVNESVMRQYCRQGTTASDFNNGSKLIKLGLSKAVETEMRCPLYF